MKPWTAPGRPRCRGPHSGQVLLRCAPHVVGVLLDALSALQPWVETEINSVNDNPIIDAENGNIHHGGNFYGGHVCFAMDGLKNVVANVADLLDRQTLGICTPESNGGLPRDLVSPGLSVPAMHHGFKAMQIAASALTAEALKLSMPASVFSRSTESHNQDKVSMGTIAARDALRALTLAERVAAIAALAGAQGLDIRQTSRQDTASSPSDNISSLLAHIRELSPGLEGDRPLQDDIERVADSIRHGRFASAAGMRL